MNNGDFQKFCYEEYKRSLASIEDGYRRYPFALTVIIVLGTGIGAVGSNDYWDSFFVSTDSTVYYLSLACAIASLVCATGYLISSVLPKEYENLGSAREYFKWREIYRSELQAHDTFSDQQMDDAVELHGSRVMTERFIQAIDSNTNAARRRMRLYNHAVYGISISVVCIGIAAGSLWVIRMRSRHVQQAAAATNSTPASQPSGEGGSITR